MADINGVTASGGRNIHNMTAIVTHRISTWKATADEHIDLTATKTVIHRHYDHYLQNVLQKVMK